MKRYNNYDNFVPAQRTDQRPTMPLQLPSFGQDAIVHDESALQALGTIQETATPVDRALGLGIRSMIWLVPWLALAVFLFLLFDSAPFVAFFVFAVLTSITVYFLNEQEYRHSAAGVERLKIEQAAELKSLELEHKQEIRLQALRMYERRLEGEND